MGNQIHFSADGRNNTYIVFDYQNRIEKYSSDGKLLWRSDRKLNYSMAPPKAKGSKKRSGGRQLLRAYAMVYEQAEKVEQEAIVFFKRDEFRNAAEYLIQSAFLYEKAKKKAESIR